MEDREFRDKVLYKLGGIESEIKALCKREDRFTDRLNSVEKKTNKHDVIIGKFGAGLAVIVFAVSVVINFVTDFIKDKFIK